MVFVFLIFATLSMVQLKEMGVGLAVAVLLDATVVRAVLLPATMKLLGARNWYLPRWLGWLPAAVAPGASADWAASPAVGRAAAGHQGRCVMDTIQFAVAAAVHAPSVHNTQPWRFGRGERTIDVYADTDRRLRVADPAGRELMISCGAAVFTLRVALRYLGWLPHVRLFPDSSRPALVARVSWDEDRIAADPYEREMYAAVIARHTHRGGFGPAPLPSGTIAALRAEAAREGAMLRVVAVGDRQDALAAAVQAGEPHCGWMTTGRPNWRDWVVAPDSPRRDGIPPAAYPAEPAHTEPDFPGRDFAAGKGWGQAAAAAEQSPGLVCLLATSANESADWVAAGQALQRVLLRAAACGVAAALHSQPLEVPQLRDFIRVQLAARAHPQLIIRLGVTSQAGPHASIRRPIGDVLL